MNPWAVECWRLIAILLPVWLLGLMVGPAGWFVAIALALYLLYQFRQLHRLIRWLRAGGRRDSPQAGGLWGEVFYAIDRLQQAERKRKQKLTSMLTRFAESTAAMPDATVVISAGGEIGWLNDAAQQLLGLRPRQDVGRRLTHLIRHPAFVDYLAAGDYTDPLEIPGPVNDNIQLSVHIVPYGNDQRLLLARDVTRLHRLEVMRRDFIANVSHELRTPLTVITGYLEELGELTGRTPAGVKPVIRTLQDQAERMRRIVEDLLTLSRLELSDAATDDQSPVPVPSLVAEIETEAAMLSRDKRHSLESTLDKTLWLRGNAKELHSAFSNLVSNAIRYTPKGGRIRLRWYGDDAGAHFEVEDNGIGIEVQHIARLTERFYRVSKDRSRSSGGTGLGLAIVKHVLQRHDAGLRIESEPGKGATFICDFPAGRIVQKAHQADAAALS